MRTPDFWRHTSLLSFLLSPAGHAYHGISRFHRALVSPCRIAAPVICVGNALAGGAGKTPVTLALGRMLADCQHAPYALTRGYGGMLPGPLRVDPDRHSAADVGDEALLLARALPTIMAKDRVAGAHLAAESGATCVVMDDGLQNPALHKDLSLLVLDGRIGIGNGRLVPAGPLREPLARAYARSDAVIVLHGEEATFPLPADKPVIWGRTVPSCAHSLANRKLLAFAGIAYPQKFYASLRELGGEIAHCESFPDHHPYTQRELERLETQAKVLGAILITTAKDAVRIPGAWKDGVWIADICAMFDNETVLRSLIPSLTARV